MKKIKAKRIKKYVIKQKIRSNDSNIYIKASEKFQKTKNIMLVKTNKKRSNF